MRAKRSTAEPSEAKHFISKIMLSEEQVEKFRTLYKNRFGKEISREEAYEKGAKLVRLMEIIYKPMTEKEYSELQKRREETK